MMSASDLKAWDFFMCIKPITVSKGIPIIDEIITYDEKLGKIISKDVMFPMRR